MSPASHRALVRRPADARGRTLVDVVRVPTPRLGPGDVLLAPLTAGICGTDWQILRGLRDDASPVPGHEGLARVVDPGDSDLAEGSLVMVNPTHPDDPSFLLGHNLPGLWAERTRIPATAVRAGLVLPVPEAAARRPSVAALAEPLASVLYGMRIGLGVAEPASLVVWGDGTVGRLAAEVWARHLPGLHRLVIGHGAGAIGPDDPGLGDRLAELPAPVAAVIATPRTGTSQALATVDRHVAGPLLVDVHAGLASGEIPLGCGDVDVAAVRAANCGGLPWPPDVRTLPRRQGPLLLYGHRGVSGRHLLDAVGLLIEDERVGEGLLTHRLDPPAAADLINTVLTSAGRHVDGRRVLKAAIRFGDG
ncbi:alcohol dehydrogenase catalytic domain-containing protein [Actinacidiphila acididurans]|uniref:Alcohol dehydrogenase catalytic domain-containing protein n=1 Tax=Actinacidiphila acididurans TaxID=2784346 RepID=A0ABS2U3U6_9ACTN|nr:alcohol dehydrogenase catalytic domain-containing protein [Actinacidiphila acididurans]MBM9510287.1 alcohol dehydrogenase catalytic domain-containing protein [Actinacidiphila acididurans]